MIIHWVRYATDVAQAERSAPIPKTMAQGYKYSTFEYTIGFTAAPFNSMVPRSAIFEKSIMAWLLSVKFFSVYSYLLSKKSFSSSIIHLSPYSPFPAPAGFSFASRRSLYSSIISLYARNLPSRINFSSAFFSSSCRSLLISSVFSARS